MDNRGKRKCEDNDEDDANKIDLTLKLGPSNHNQNPELEDDAASGVQFPALASQPFNNMGNWNGEYGRPAEVAYNWPRESGSANYMLYHPLAHCPFNNMVYAPNRKKPAVEDDKLCRVCGITSTPLWRKGPDGPQTLCNACGLRYLRTLKKGGDQ